MKTLALRLQHALDKRKKTPADLSRATGKTESAVSQWLNGPTKSMRGDNLMATCAFLRCNAAWLSSNKGPSGLDDDLVPGADIGVSESPAVAYLPRSTPSATMIRLAEFLLPLDATDREQAKAILSALVKDPEDAMQIAAKFERLLGGGTVSAPSEYAQPGR